MFNISENTTYLFVYRVRLFRTVCLILLGVSCLSWSDQPNIRVTKTFLDFNKFYLLIAIVYYLQIPFHEITFISSSFYAIMNSTKPNPLKFFHIRESSRFKWSTKWDLSGEMTLFSRATRMRYTSYIIMLLILN